MTTKGKGNGKRAGDLELGAIRRIMGILENMTHAEKSRVLRFVHERIDEEAQRTTQGRDPFTLVEDERRT